MASTLHELAVKLQESIIRQQEDAHNVGSINIAKYNNLKLIMDPAINYPHITIRIGISEATYNLNDSSRTDGSLGPDERYVRRWLASSSVITDLTDIYKLLEEGTNEENDDAELSHTTKKKKLKKAEISGMGNINANISGPKLMSGKLLNRKTIRRDLRSILDSSVRSRRLYHPTEPPEDFDKGKK